MTLVVGTAALAIAKPVGPVVFVLLAIHAWRGAKESLEALALLGLLLLGSRALFPEGVTIFRWVILFSACGRLIWDSAIFVRFNQNPLRFLAAMGLFAVWCLVGAFTVSPVPTLSILKVVSFVVGASTLVVCFYRTSQIMSYWRDWFYTLFVFMIWASVLAYPLGIGNLRTVQGFQGIFQHPMTFGPVAASIAAWLGGIWLTSDRRVSWHIPGTALLASYFVYSSLSRTALLALCGGFAIGMVLSLFRRDTPAPWHFMGSSKVWWVASLILIAGILFAPQLKVRVSEFINKDDVQGGDVAELFQSSRGSLVSESMTNFRSYPVTGIGFGIPSDLQRIEQQLETVAGIPVSASAEKGFMPSAVLEEVGVIGAILVVWMVLIMLTPVVKWGGFSSIWLLCTSGLVNIGQAVFFSIGGPGFFMWLMVAFCLAQAAWQEHEFATNEDSML